MYHARIIASMNRGLVVFDLDGTIADSRPGIFHCYRRVAADYGVVLPEGYDLTRHLGGPLPSNLKALLGLDDDEVLPAVMRYRDHYVAEGESMAEPFDGIAEAIGSLLDSGFSVAVATMKVHKYAVRMLEGWGIAGSMSSIHGADYEGVLTKADLIRMCMDDSDASDGNTVMVGDSMDDLLAAESCGVRFIGACYGYNMTSEMCRSRGHCHADSTSDIPSIVSSCL